MDQTLEEIVFQYRLLRQQVNNRQISPEQYVQAVTQLQGMDHFGYYWRIDPQKNNYLRFDGVAWIVTPLPLGLTANSLVQPQFIQPPVPPPAPQNDFPVTTPTPESILPGVPAKLQRFFSKHPLVAYLPLFGFAILWFLYTIPATIKGEGIGGIDWFTPFVIGFIPLLLWFFRRRLTGLINLAHKIMKPFPRILKIFIPLILPLVLGCGCGFVTGSGYMYLALVTTLSIIFSGLVFRVADTHGDLR